MAAISSSAEAEGAGRYEQSAGRSVTPVSCVEPRRRRPAAFVVLRFGGMRNNWTMVAALACVVITPGVGAQTPYTIAYASFAPLNAEIFLAAADGSDAKPFQSSPAQDFNASFSHDGQWIVFTSTRNGSADIYRAHPDGSALERLTDDPAFDDQGALSPDGRRLAFVSTRSGHTDIWTLDLRTH